MAMTLATISFVPGKEIAWVQGLCVLRVLKAERALDAQTVKGLPVPRVPLFCSRLLS